jgi:hypothetical protein
MEDQKRSQLVAFSSSDQLFPDLTNFLRFYSHGALQQQFF